MPRTIGQVVDEILLMQEKIIDLLACQQETEKRMLESMQLMSERISSVQSELSEMQPFKEV